MGYNMVQAWNVLTEVAGVSEDALTIITKINGYNLETLTDVLYAVTGYRDFEQYQEEWEV